MQKIQHVRIDQQESGGSHASPKKHAVKGKTHIGICQKQRERKAKEGSSQSDGSLRKADHASFEAGTHVFLQSGIFHAEKRLVYKHRLTYDTLHGPSDWIRTSGTPTIVGVPAADYNSASRPRGRWFIGLHKEKAEYQN